MDELVMGMLNSDGGKLAKISNKIVSTILKGNRWRWTSLVVFFAAIPLGLTALIPVLLIGVGGGAYIKRSGLKPLIDAIR